MAFQNATNTGRVARMVETLDLIEASATSNRTAPEEVRLMLGPILDRLSAYRGAETAPVAAAPTTPAAPPRPGSNRAWASVREMAEQADLADLTVAMAVYLDRIGAAFDTMGPR